MGNVVDLLGLPADLLPGLLVSRLLQGPQDNVFQVQVHRLLMYPYHLGVGGREGSTLTSLDLAH